MLCPRCHRRYEDDHAFCPHDGERLAPGADIRRIRSQPTEYHGVVVGGRYQIRGLLGKGGMGQVFLCLDQTRDVPVALKVLDPRLLKDPSARARFILEARSAAKIVHPNIIEVLDVGLHPNGTPYIAMEFLHGESLGSLLRRERVMAPEQAISIARDVASGLAAAHAAGVVHRDVKPDNVFLLGERGVSHSVKILDFSLARNNEVVGFTKMGMAVGTLDYMAPEQAMCDAVDARTDIYGLGVVLYRMLRGELPFRGKAEQDIMAAQLIEPAPPLNLGPTRVQRGLEAILQKALRKRPENRYASMDALIADLARLQRARDDSIPDGVLGAPSARSSLAADQPLAAPDVYIPQNPIGLRAARFFYQSLGKEPPPGIA
jgi:serine/threonine protein kinase